MEFKKSSTDMRTALCDLLIELSASNSQLVWLDADLMASSGMKKFQEKFPDRTINCGIQEANMMGVAAGLSAEGMIPFVHSFAAFSSRRIVDQIFVSGIYAKQNIRIIGSDPGISGGPNGGTHMSLEDIGILRSLPKTIIVDPCDAIQLASVVRQSIENKGIFYIRLMRKSQTQIYDAHTTFEIGKAVTVQDGSDLTIIASGTICMIEALEAARYLALQSISVRVLDMFTVKPLDVAAVQKAAQETKAIITVENHNIYNGLGSAVAEVLAEGTDTVKFKRLGVPDCVGEVGTIDYLLKKFKFSSQDIIETAFTLLEK